ncbi:MAG TPA: hypothetical protein VFS20_12740 [Longimicrobium sp.]|nr:hypothetical protein [Longimicrobium sp.]
MSIVGDLLEGTLLYDARGNAYAQPLLARGKTFRVPPDRQNVVGVFVGLLKGLGWTAALLSMLVFGPGWGITALAALLALHPASVWLFARRFQPADAADLGTRAERLLRLAHNRGERQILANLSQAALMLALGLACLGWGYVYAGILAAGFGAALALQNLPLLRLLRSTTQTQTRAL